MADRSPNREGRNTPSPGPLRRQRAPTITIDTSAVNNDMSHNDVPLNNMADTASRTEETSPVSKSSPTDPLAATNSFDGNGDRPTSPHNVSSATHKWGTDPNSFLAVPGPRSRGNSVDSQTDAASNSETYVNTSPTLQDSHNKALGHDEILNDQDALTPDPGTEDLFEVQDNRFAFTPGQLGKLYNPKSLGAFHALGGLTGLERGLRTDRKSGLSVDEQTLDGTISFEEATAPQAHSTKDIEHRPAPSDSEKGGVKPGAFVDRTRIFSDNRLPEKKAKSIWELAWMAYNDKVLILLTAAAVISLALGLYETFGGDHEDGKPKVEWVEGVAIIVAILIVVVVGALNDWQKERQFVKLNKKKSDRLVKVIRSGKTREVSVYDVLVGDVMLLEPGDMIPADGIFIAGHNVKCDESSATGESDLLKKMAAEDVYQAMEEGRVGKKMDPFILSGAKVAEGVGSFLVTNTGIHSSYGKTMMALREDAEVTPLQSKLNVLAEYIAKLGGGSALLLFIVLFIEFLVKLSSSDQTPAQKGQKFLDILIVAITVIVVAVPEGLPLAVTLALAFATTRMLKDNNLVRLLRSCETMGNATTVCSDKTGTLTQNKMTVVAGSLGTAFRFGDRRAAAVDKSQTGSEDQGGGGGGGGDDDDDDDDVTPSEFVSNLGPEIKQLFEQSIVVNSTAFEGFEDGKPAFVGSKTETALLSFARDHLGMGSVNTERSNANVVQLFPFDSARKCMGAVVKLDNAKYRVYVKGASEIMVAQATDIVDATKELSVRPLTTEIRETITHLIETYASRSLRTIAFLYQDFESWPPRGARQLEDDSTQANFDDVNSNMTFLGLVGIQDPLRDGVPEAVRDCQRAGVFVRMVTGDNVLTAKAIAEDCGILVAGGLVMEGPKFRKLSRRQMDQVIPKLCVLARSSPEDKRILVKRLKELGETVAVTGDGTNDAPALKTADIGFSMGIAGTEVAKEASAIILMDDNFSSIVKALLWGRAVNDAVKKFLQFQVTVNITAVILTFVSAVASSDQTSVLTAVQLLWVNLIMDTFAALALATDPPSPSMLDRKPDPKSAPLITITMWKMIIGQAIYQLVVTFVLYFAGESILGYESQREKDQMGTLVFNTFVWMTIFNQMNSRRLDNRFNIFEGLHRNFFFIIINCIMIGGQTMIIFVGGAAFSVVRLNGPQWAYSIVLGAISVPIGVVIRCVPDELIDRCIPERLKRKPTTPDLIISDDFEWNQGLLEIREELAFIKKIRGGRLGALKFKLQHPREAFALSRSSHSLPQTPQNERSDGEGGSPAPPTPSTRSRGRSRSNSAFGPAAAMAGIVAGSIAGWSPIERRDGDNDVSFARVRSKSDVEAQDGIDLHASTRADDPVVVKEPERLTHPPSQSTDTTPAFGLGPFGGQPKVEMGDDDDDRKDTKA